MNNLLAGTGIAAMKRTEAALQKALDDIRTYDLSMCTYCSAVNGIRLSASLSP
jgi:hypothetical protein